MINDAAYNQNAIFKVSKKEFTVKHLDYADKNLARKN